ncbi:MAG: hypothetical protein WKF34_07080 [Pyrinomonadaceae bacterium]
MADDKFGQIQIICLRSRSCKVHYPHLARLAKSESANVDAAAEREAEVDKKRQRREELFDIRVSDIVRRRVFRLAAERFAGEFLISQESNGFLPRLVAKLWVISNNGDAAHTRGMASRLMGEITDAENGNFASKTTISTWQ